MTVLDRYHVYLVIANEKPNSEIDIYTTKFSKYALLYFSNDCA